VEVGGEDDVAEVKLLGGEHVAVVGVDFCAGVIGADFGDGFWRAGGDGGESCAVDRADGAAWCWPQAP